MWRHHRYGRIVFWVLALTFFVVRASDTHLHLCFDGQEPPTSVHLADASVHHDDDHHEGEHHDDQDVRVSIALLLKSAGIDPDAALCASVVALVLLLPPPQGAAPLARDPVPLALGQSFHLRPPLRGPPV